MKQVKSYYQQLSHNGYVWVGFWANLHHFTKGDYNTGFYDVAVLESEIEDGSWKWYCDNGYTRS